MTLPARTVKYSVDGPLRPADTSWRQRLNPVIKNYELYLYLLPAITVAIIFLYVPMYGMQIAFKDFFAVKGILGSPWVGLKHFERFFNSYAFRRVIRNTIVLSFYLMLAGFPMPLILALLLNQLNHETYKRVIQTVIYAPFFISIIVLAGMIYVFLSPRTGIVNLLIAQLGGEKIFFLASSGWFPHIYVFSNVWQKAGWGTIIYLAALSSVDPELHEAAIVDGANKLKRVIHIDLPTILPTAVILLILNFGRMMSLGFERVFSLQTPLNLETSEIISTYIYKVGILGAQYSFSTAIGLFQAIINFLLLTIINKIAKRVSDTSLW